MLHNPQNPVSTGPWGSQCFQVVCHAFVQYKQTHTHTYTYTYNDNFKTKHVSTLCSSCAYQCVTCLIVFIPCIVIEGEFSWSMSCLSFSSLMTLWFQTHGVDIHPRRNIRKYLIRTTDSEFPMSHHDFLDPKRFLQPTTQALKLTGQFLKLRVWTGCDFFMKSRLWLKMRISYECKHDIVPPSKTTEDLTRSMAMGAP